MMKSCSGKPCNQEGDCEICGMADVIKICPKCGNEMDELDGSYHPYIRYCRVCPYSEKVEEK